MIVYDESGERLDNYDTDAGRVRIEEKDVLHRWVVDAEEEGEWVTVAEYPETGGSDVEWRVTSPEEGHWSTVDADTGEAVTDFDGTLSDDWPHDVPVPDVFEYAIYHPYTEEELEELEKQRQEAEAEAERKRAIDEGCQAFFIDGGKTKMEQDIEDAATSGGTDPQLKALATLQIATMDLTSVTSTGCAAFRDYWPEWKPDTQYKQNDPLQWKGVYYRVSQDTTSSSVYPPDTAGESLYYPITIAPDGIIVYRTCHGAYDMVRAGETRHYPDAEGPVYRAKVDTAYDPDTVPANWELVPDAGTE